MADTAQILTANHLRKSFKKREVVKNVSLQVKSGEVVGLLGPNGAGKTTCFYMIVGLIPADSGSNPDAFHRSQTCACLRSRLGIRNSPFQKIRRWTLCGRGFRLSLSTQSQNSHFPCSLRAVPTSTDDCHGNTGRRDTDSYVYQQGFVRHCLVKSCIKN